MQDIQAEMEMIKRQYENSLHTEEWQFHAGQFNDEEDDMFNDGMTFEEFCDTLPYVETDYCDSDDEDEEVVANIRNKKRLREELLRQAKEAEKDKQENRVPYAFQFALRALGVTV